MRLPAIAPADLKEAQKLLFASMADGVGAKYQDFVTRRDDGAMLGPWNAWLHDREIGSACWRMTQAVTRAKRIPDGPRQIAIMVVGAHFGAAYEIYAHAAVARSHHHMAEARLAAITAGERPDELDEDEATAHGVAKALPRGAPFDDLFCACALMRFGQSGTNELNYPVGQKCFVSRTLNGFAIPAP